MRFSFEYFGYEQYTYFYTVVEEKYSETIEGLIYSIFPEAEIRRTKDYTTKFDPNTQGIAGTNLKLREKDVYPIRTYDQFDEDSMSRLFSVVSKIESGEQVWVQIIMEPHDDTGLYHFRRNWRFYFVRIKKFSLFETAYERKVLKVSTQHDLNWLQRKKRVSHLKQVFASHTSVKILLKQNRNLMLLSIASTTSTTRTLMDLQPLEFLPIQHLQTSTHHESTVRRTL